MSVGKLLRSYLFWTYERGSLHYDVMVTLILIFLFLSPRLVDFKDRPVETVALRASEVLVKEAGNGDGQTRFVYQIRAEQVQGGAGMNDEEQRAALMRVIEPISGEVTLERYEPLKDPHGKIVAWNAWVVR